MRLRRRTAAAVVSMWGLACQSAEAALPTYTDRIDGISCRSIDAGLGLPWASGSPAWRDRKGTLSGPAAFAVHTIAAGDTVRVRRIDITALVLAWWRPGAVNQGLLLRHVAGNPLVLLSREFADVTIRPALVLMWADGHRRIVEPQADAALDCSTYRPQGTLDTLLVASHSAVAMRFAVPAAGRPTPPTSAQFWLTRAPVGLGTASTIEVQALDLELGAEGQARLDGLASRHPGDRDIEQSPEVVFVDRFEGPRLNVAWDAGATNHW